MKKAILSAVAVIALPNMLMAAECVERESASLYSFDIEVLKSSLPNVVKVKYLREPFGENRMLPWLVNMSKKPFYVGLPNEARKDFVVNEKYRNKIGYAKAEGSDEWIKISGISRIYGSLFMVADEMSRKYKTRKPMPEKLEIPLAKEIVLPAKYGVLDYEIRATVTYRKNDKFVARDLICNDDGTFKTKQKKS